MPIEMWLPCVYTARVDNSVLSVQSERQKLLTAVTTYEQEKLPRSTEVEEGVSSAMQALSDRVQQLIAHCSVMLVTDGLRDWQGAQADRTDRDSDHNNVRVCLLVGSSGVSSGIK